MLLKHNTEVLDLFNKRDETAIDFARNNGYVDYLNVLKAEYDNASMFWTS